MINCDNSLWAMNGNYEIMSYLWGDTEEARKKRKDIFKKNLEMNNIIYWEYNGYLFFRKEEKEYIYMDDGYNYIQNICFEDFSRVETKIIKGFTFYYREVKKIKKPCFSTILQIYEMIKSFHDKNFDIFFEGFSLEDIVYIPSINTYFILTKKSSKRLITDKIKIKWSNIFFNKSIFLHKENEIKTCEELDLILGGSHENNWCR